MWVSELFMFLIYFFFKKAVIQQINLWSELKILRTNKQKHSDALCMQTSF